MSPVEYRAPAPHECGPPYKRLGARSWQPDGTVNTVHRCDTCGRRWVVTETHDVPPTRVWRPLRVWHRAARRGLREGEG